MESTGRLHSSRCECLMMVIIVVVVVVTVVVMTMTLMMMMTMMTLMMMMMTMIKNTEKKVMVEMIEVDQEFDENQQQLSQRLKIQDELGSSSIC